MSKKDASVATFVLVHNAIGNNVVAALGDEEQKKRILSETIPMNKYICFGLTEPDYGSDATSLKTNAKRVDGGYLINGQKRWIGNATFADYIIIWAKNPSENNNIQAFVVTKGSKGLKTSKIENKYSLRMVQNTDIVLEDVFVPDHNKLTHAKDFKTGLNSVLESSRLMVAWLVVGCAAGAYEAALKYCLTRKQFGRPLAKFQLIQEKLSRMLSLVEMCISNLVLVSQAMDNGTASIGYVGRAKSGASRAGREVV